jgi:hypothetical protein
MLLLLLALLPPSKHVFPSLLSLLLRTALAPLW